MGELLGITRRFMPQPTIIPSSSQIAPVRGLSSVRGPRTTSDTAPRRSSCFGVF